MSKLELSGEKDDLEIEAMYDEDRGILQKCGMSWRAIQYICGQDFSIVSFPLEGWSHQSFLVSVK